MKVVPLDITKRPSDTQSNTLPRKTVPLEVIVDSASKKDHVVIDSNSDNQSLNSLVLANVTSSEIEKTSENITTEIHQYSKIYQDDFQKEIDTQQIETPSIPTSNNTPSRPQNDWLWSIIAITCIVAAGLFYFGGFQPALLQNYAQIAKNQSVELTSVFQSQITQVQEIQDQVIPEIQAFSTTTTCSDLSPTELPNEIDITTINRLLLPKSNLTELPRSTVVYNAKIKQNYQDLYSEYEQQLTQATENLQQSLLTRSALTYQNTWITTCKDFSQSQGNVSQLSSACQTFTKTTEDIYSAQLDSQYRQQIIAFQKKGQDLCGELEIYRKNNPGRSIFANYSRWLSSWNAQVSALLQINPVQTNFDDVTNQLTNELISKAQETQQKINDEINSKSTFQSKFYLLDFEI